MRPVLPLLSCVLLACDPEPPPVEEFEPARPYLLATYTDGIRAFPPEGGPGRHVIDNSYINGHGLAALPSGNILLCGRRFLNSNPEVDVLEFSPRFVLVGTRVADDAMTYPANLIVLADGSFVGVDPEQNEVRLFGADGALKKVVLLSIPRDVALLPSGRIAVTDAATDNLVLFDSALEKVGLFAATSIGDPYAILVRQSGEVWIGRLTDSTIGRYSADGVLLGTIPFGDFQTVVTAMVELGPNEVAVASHPLTTDIDGASSIQVIDGAGQVLRTLTSNTTYRVRDLLLATVEIPKTAPAAP